MPFLQIPSSHSHWMIAPVAMALAASAACGGGEGALRPGAEAQEENVTAASATSAGGCTGTDEGCPCRDEGETAACQGPRIHVGNYVSCAPGVRVCLSGKWGACLGKTLYSDVDSMTQNYASPCPPGVPVRWGALTLTGATPGDSRIDVAAQTADSASDLGAIAPKLLGSLDGDDSAAYPIINIGSSMTAAGDVPRSFLRVTLNLVRASQTAQRPVVMGWQVASSCDVP